MSTFRNSVADFQISDPALAAEGRRVISLSEGEMPGLMELRRIHGSTKPLKGARIAGSLHMTVETAILIETLTTLGAEVRWSSSNRFSTHDGAAAALAMEGIPIFAWKGESESEYVDCLQRTLRGPNGWLPNLILDDGGDLTELLHDDYPDLAESVRGITEETTTGCIRVRKLERDGRLRSPAFAVNDSVTKSKFDNIYGCRESMLDGIKRATDVMIAGKSCVVVGFGDVGKGCAESFRAMGGTVFVVEIDPICALQATMQGYEVTTMEEAARFGDIFVTATGCKDVVRRDHLDRMKEGAIVGNIGHSDTEFDIASLYNDPRIERQAVKPLVERMIWPTGKSIIVLAEGRLLNLGCATGHPAFVMSASFSNQVLAQMELWSNGADLEPRLYRLPKHLDEQVARLHLKHLGAKLTVLTPSQSAYLGIPKEGPFKPDHYRY